MNETTFTPSVCHIDLSCIKRNFQKMGDPEHLLPVIKSDAYGHGLFPVARTLDSAGCVSFAVGTVAEGRALREYGYVRQRIVALLGALSCEEWRLCHVHHILAPVVDMESMKMAAQACPQHETLPCAIALNTGMGRLGFTQEQMPDLLEGLHRYPMLRPELVLSHFACADMPEEAIYTHAQQERFESMTKALRAFFPDIMRSINNSAGLQCWRGSACELERPGITLYGGNPFVGTEWESRGAGFEWAMSVCAPIIQVRTVRAGESISYGRIFTAPHPMTVAVVAMGYATGFSRALSNRTDLLIHGVRCPQVGRVCMGMIMADVTRVLDVESGNLAWILGGTPEAGHRAVTADELARELDTISYEVLCHFGATNPRIYHS